jgi:hypothetical protein
MAAVSRSGNFYPFFGGGRFRPEVNMGARRIQVAAAMSGNRTNSPSPEFGSGFPSVILLPCKLKDSSRIAPRP